MNKSIFWIWVIAILFFSYFSYRLDKESKQPVIDCDLADRVALLEYQIKYWFPEPYLNAYDRCAICHHNSKKGVKRG